MTSKSSRSRRRRGPRFCPLSERDVINSEYGSGSFPPKQEAQREVSCPSTIPEQSGDISPNQSSAKEHSKQYQRSPSGVPIGDTFDENETPGDSTRSTNDKKKKKSKSLARFLFAKSKLFQKKRKTTQVQEPNPADDTVVYEDILNGSPERQRNANDRGSVDSEVSDNRQVTNTGASEDQEIVNDELPTTQAKPTDNEIRPFPLSLDADVTAPSKKKAKTPLPFTEIMKYQRRNSGSSDVSSLSGAGARSKDIPLEFYLAMDMRERASSKMFNDDILNIAGQDNLQLQQSHSTENSAWEPLPTCLILLTDPMQRIFEMVSVMYAPKKDTVAKILRRCTKNAKDERLKKQKYVGLAYDGNHCRLDMIPQDAIRKSVADCKPLMAIPAKYSAHQIQIVGKSLLASPFVQQLLDHQLKSMGLRHNGDSKAKEPELPITQIVVPPKRNSRKVETA